MNFKIIKNEQTPRVNTGMEEPALNYFIKNNYSMFEKFISFASRQKTAVGLAANQVSLNGERIMLRFFAIKHDHRWELILNPKILKFHGIGTEQIETCLTWPGRKIKVKRWYSIDVSYYSLKGESIHGAITGLQAQIWQHEHAHIFGTEEKFI